ncbi:glycosyltransferase family 4 protein [Frankia sp. CNm7]|uniref:Glycosyltransferase family 4 protein n=1 Tax=Frankia nepalensis TaxID=1836974 RepID=A0A937UWG5_9ACTN|nr:glycosyltransferase family 4 protein [Frankia nepalensis]MBL7497489.1 glycosyltransferase family 4 protein [Frankia nepalensis]MBL7509570.1 glycosyltransferase family 4 protein [Frankia nepalensis]MBL7517744.1 glycosyltransferase family 4 protein [Frankia nepalensis]MBL7633391.1 glycosyltransferase family 4 protein [Frankia nepalensis]
MHRTLIVADKFPPVMGGIQTFAYCFAATLPADKVLVVAPPHPDAPKLDADAPFEIIRHRAANLRLPGVGPAISKIARAEGCAAAWFPAGTPRGMIAPALRRAGVEWVVSSTHGHEYGWSHLPYGYSLVRSVAGKADVVTHLTDVTLRRLRKVAPAGTRFERLTGGVDVDRFQPGTGGADIRRRHGWGGRPIVACVARLVPRKGQDVLIRGLPSVLRNHPDALLVIVGRGRHERWLRRLAATAGVERNVEFVGAVTDEELPAYLDAADVFAMPSRPAKLGLDLEGLGLSALEAAAAGVPVITGAAGGAPEVVIPGETGLVVDGANVTAVTGAVNELLADPDRARRMGAAGRDWMSSAWTWEHLGGRLASLLAGPAGQVGSAGAARGPFPSVPVPADEPSLVSSAPSAGSSPPGAGPAPTERAP